ncbi:AbrB/MazE/SpoVT family DNA-binding domain-containing protein [Methylobacterium sp. J-078]|uniref:AbrB/MazE/SpoVT family DNA-binding domain-containing protein n=1 Tax=Methylobacterium sp. J-078 TaxID=2836657 RepID=UPI001FBBA4AD|nr:AbrB/MazE/SpoVT family DNA-binding domain-containing protein [Methylobacterium sp. J-078]MCJ2043306.1 AbrB/MazE/SpoVT family DNA-binding domain-containing protein [Methylobacterium sp. J-078]
MIVQFAKWGNSVALRIPSATLREAGIKEGSSADLSYENGRIVLTPVMRPRRHDLAELLSRVTDENVQAQAFDGPEVGSEVW